MVKPYDDDRLSALERQVALLTALAGGAGGGSTGVTNGAAGGGAGAGFPVRETAIQPARIPVAGPGVARFLGVPVECVLETVLPPSTKQPVQMPIPGPGEVPDQPWNKRPTRTGYIDANGYHPGPSYVGFDAHADWCEACAQLRLTADDYVDRRHEGAPPWARDVPMPDPPVEPVRLGRWARLCAWLRYRSASWPTARTVRR